MAETRMMERQRVSSVPGTRPRRGGSGQWLTYLLLIAGSIVMMVPFAWLVRSSLMSTAQIFIFPPEWIPRPVEWSNYSKALTVVPFATYARNTILLEILVIPGVLLTSSAAAYSFSRLRWPGRDWVFGLLLATLMLPYAVTLIPVFLLWRGLDGINTFAPLVVPAWFGGGVFNIFLLRQFMRGIPKELDEAAYMDGANPLIVLFHILVPLSKSALIVVAIFTFIGVWNDFLGPLIYLNSDSMKTLALGLASFRGMYNAQWGYLMAASTAVLMPILILFFVAQRHFVQGIALTGIKG